MPVTSRVYAWLGPALRRAQLWRDWRIVVGVVMGTAAGTLLVINLREAFRR